MGYPFRTRTILWNLKIRRARVVNDEWDLHDNVIFFTTARALKVRVLDYILSKKILKVQILEATWNLAQKALWNKLNFSPTIILILFFSFGIHHPHTLERTTVWLKKLGTSIIFQCNGELYKLGQRKPKTLTPFSDPAE